MTMNTLRLGWIATVLLPLTFIACNKDDDNNPPEGTEKRTITVENVLNSRTLVESGTYQGEGTPPVILPG